MDQPASENLPNQTASTRPSEAVETKTVETADGQENPEPTAEPMIASTGQPLDDEVQYLISVPRRRRKKRKKHGTHLDYPEYPQVTENRMGSFQAAIRGVQCPTSSMLHHATPIPQSPQRNSAGISRPVEACHIQDHQGSQFPAPRACSAATLFQQNINLPARPGTGLQPMSAVCFPNSARGPAPTRSSDSVSFPQQGWSFAPMSTPSTKRKRTTGSEAFQASQPSLQSSYPPALHAESNRAMSVDHSTRITTIPSALQMDLSDWSLFGPSDDPKVFNWDTLTWEYPPLHQTSVPMQLPTPLQASTNSAPEISPPPERPPQEHPPRLSQPPPQQLPDAPVSAPTISHGPEHPPPVQTLVSDLRRHPSLYKIPPWVPPSMSSTPLNASNPQANSPRQTARARQFSPQISPRTIPVQAVPQPQPTHTSSVQPVPAAVGQFRPPSQGRNTETYISPYAPITGQLQRPNTSVPQLARPISIQRQQRQDSSPSSSAETFINSDSLSLSPSSNGSSGASQRTHSPNLLVDIAETCQELFPFEMVAQRHNTKLQKVFDAFSAIIQIPLLRNTTDNRRNGPLGAQRMKEFRNAKRVAKEAHEEERKAKRHYERRNTVLSGDKRADKTPDLLRAALLNKARDAQAS